MDVEPLGPFDDVLVITPKRHGDARGFFSEVWNARDFVAAGVDAQFVQHNHTASPAAGTLRGLHYQAPPHAQAKLVRVAVGAVFDVVVDLRGGSPTFGRWAGVELSAANWRQIWVPAGFAHAYCTLVADSHVLYATTDYYAPDAEHGVAFDDPALSIAWPFDADALTLSARDRGWPRLIDAPRHFA